MLPEKTLGWGTSRSCIRELFEYGCRRKAEIGAENVFDYSLGNPSIPAPACVNEAIAELLTGDSVTLHGYTSAVGLASLREAIAKDMNRRYGAGTLELTLRDSYYNMKEKILPHMHLIDTARRAMLTLDVEPIISPVRGGTDGARLSYMGLPCPNICTGGHNYHGCLEYIPVQSMEKVCDILMKIIEYTYE